MGLPGRLRALARGVWVTLAALLALLTLADLVGSIANAHYDSHLNRSPGAQIVIAVMGFATALGALSGAVGTLPRRSARIGPRAGAAFTLLTVLLIFLYAAVSVLSGPL